MAKRDAGRISHARRVPSGQVQLLSSSCWLIVVFMTMLSATGCSKHYSRERDQIPQMCKDLRKDC